MLMNGEIGDWIGSFEGHKGAMWSVCLDTNALRVAFVSADFTTKVWDALTDAPLREVDKSLGSVKTIAWMHSDQTILISYTDMGGVRLWDVRSGKIVQTLETKSLVTSAEVSQDFQYITTTDGSTVKFWDTKHFSLVKSYTMPYTVESASLESKYGNKFITGGEDIWVCGFFISILGMR
ncbi:hypothetical protein CRYUN_Cryun17cG0079100 [Craigia yunnanensis]